MSSVELFPSPGAVEFEGQALWHVTNLAQRILGRPISIERTVLPITGMTLWENAILIDSAAAYLEDEFDELVEIMDSIEFSRFEFECSWSCKRFAVSTTARAHRIFVHSIDECGDDFEQLQFNLAF